MSDPVIYTLRFPAPATHYVEIEAVYPLAGPVLDLFMAVWTPGSYLVREYARHVESVTACTEQGRPLPVEKTAKNRWRVSGNDTPRVLVRYRVYGREMSVRTNWIESGFALLNGAPTFLAVINDLQRPHAVNLELPEGWTTSMTGLNPVGAHAYLAPDYDTLVDCPIVAGNSAIYPFTVDDKPHYLVNEGDASFFDGERAARDLTRIVETCRDFWGDLPYERYLFLNLLTDAGGGLEHANSTVLMASRFTTRNRVSYVGQYDGPSPRGGWLGLACHEFFHVWNVKRLRPLRLGPFEYERENYTTSLWVSEGLTTYYGDLLVHRAGLITQDEYLAALSRAIDQLQTTPGRLVQPLAQASFDAWIKEYRPDEHSPNSAISYYVKGAVVGFLVDVKIRRAAGNERSLDDAMRLAYRRYAGERGFTEDEFREILEETAGLSLQSWLAEALTAPVELAYDDTIEWLGLRWRSKEKHGKEEKAWLGAATKVDHGRLVVTQVRRDTPAYAAGVNADDEILAIEGVRVRPDGLARRLEEYRPGETVELLVARRDRLTKLMVAFGREPEKRRLEPHPEATAAQAANLRAWLQGRN